MSTRIFSASIESYRRRVTVAGTAKRVDAPVVPISTIKLPQKPGKKAATWSDLAAYEPTKTPRRNVHAGLNLSPTYDHDLLP